MTFEELKALDPEFVLEVIIEELLLQDYDLTVEMLLSILEAPTRH